MTLDQLVRAPGVFQTDEELAEEEDFWPAVEKALKKALSEMVKMREREGAHLGQDLVEAGGGDAAGGGAGFRSTRRRWRSGIASN